MLSPSTALTQLHVATRYLSPDPVCASVVGEVDLATAPMLRDRLLGVLRGGVRAFTGLVPALDASGLTGRHGAPTKRGDAVLRRTCAPAGVRDVGRGHQRASRHLSPYDGEPAR
jgi:hypothetical protein